MSFEPDCDEGTFFTSEPRVSPLPTQVLAKVDFTTSTSDEIKKDELPVKTDKIDEANLITSLVNGRGRSFATEYHKPVLDFDFPVRALRSTNPEHSHVFLDAELTWEDYQKLLDVLDEIGLLETGYVKASKFRGYTAVRLPWIKKEQ